MILEKELQECRDDRHLTKARELEKKILKLRDPRFLLLLIGLAQILVIYSEASLVREWEKRMVRSELDIAAHSCLGKVLFMEEGGDVNTSIAAAKEHLNNLVEALPTHLQEKFEGAMLLDGYLSFQKLFKELHNEFGLHESIGSGTRSISRLRSPWS